MKKLLESKTAALLALCVVVIIIIATFPFRPVWWAFIDEFFAFMTVFSHLASVYLREINPYVGKQLDKFAMAFGVLTILSFIGEYIAYLLIYSP